MNINSILYFLEIVESQSFSKAAENLYISQSTLSLSIKNLEDELEVQLLERDRKGVTLTDDGKKILPIAKRMQEDFSQMRSISENKRDSFNEKINIYYNPSRRNFMIKKVFPFMLEHYPNWSISFIETYAGDVIKECKKDKGALGFTGSGHRGLIITQTICDQNDLVLEQLPHKEDLFLYCNRNSDFAKRDHVNYEELIDIPIAVHVGQLPSHSLTNTIGMYNRLKHMYVFSNLDDICNSIIYNNLVCIMHSDFGRNYKEMAEIPIKNHNNTIIPYIIYSKKHLNAVGQKILEMIRTEYGK